MALRPAFGQYDMGAGMVRVAPYLIPSNGAYRLRDFLLDDEANAYKRSGTTYKSDAAFNAAGLRTLWDGILAGGARTVFADAADFGTLASNDTTPVNVGGSGVTTPVKPAAIDGILFFSTEAYAGSRKTAAYTTGTVTIGTGDTTLVGVGTAWNANVDAGMILVLANRLVAVKSVTDNTHLELFREWTGAPQAGVAYRLDTVATIPSTYNPGGRYAVISNRLVSMLGERAAFSAIFDSTDWTSTDEWLLPEGVNLLGGQESAGVLLVFSTAGVWMIENMAFDLLDPSGNLQQRLDRSNRDLILWGDAGISSWRDSVIAPCVDGVWMLAPTRELGSRPIKLSNSITALYTDYVHRGYQPGTATVYRGHYLLPILDSGGVVQDLLVCRLDRPVADRRLGEIFPWTTFGGAGGNVSALAVRVSATGTRTPVLLGADRSTAARVISYGEFKPDGARHDHDGSIVNFDFISRDIAMPSRKSTVKKVRLDYELVAASDVAYINGSWGSETRAPTSLWGAFLWGAGVWNDSENLSMSTLPGQAPETNGEVPFAWRVGKRVSFFRLRLRPSTGCDRAVLRGFDLLVRSSGRV